MNTIDAVVHALGWALLHFLWQGALVGAVAALLLAQLHDARAQARYAVCLVALAACVVLPLATLLAGLPGSPAFPLPAVDAMPVAGAARPVETAAFIDAVTWRARLQPWLPAIVAAWAAGAALLALRLGFGFAWLARFGAGAGRPDAIWQARLDALAARMRLPRRVALRIVEGLDTPVVFRALRPVVLVPAALLTRLSPDLLEALLAHELAHVRRHDYLVNLLQGAVEALLFYHPVVWWLSRRARAERELVADDVAAASLGDRHRVARALDALASLQSRPDPFPELALAADGGSLVNRIRHLVSPRRPTVQWKAAIPVIGISLMCLSLAQARPADVPAGVAGDAGDDVESFALFDGDDDDGLTWMSGRSDDRAHLRELRKRIDGDFLWVRRDGREYVTRDPQVVADVRAAWAPTAPVGTQMEALGAEMEQHGAVMEAIGARMETAAGAGEPHAAKMEALGERLSETAARHVELAAKSARLAHAAAYAKDDAERARAEAAVRSLEAEQSRVQAQLDRLSAEMDGLGDALDAAHAPMAALGAEMERAAKPMDALGGRMEVLGAEMERLSAQANASTRRTIDAALRDGRLAPLDGARAPR